MTHDLAALRARLTVPLPPADLHDVGDGDFDAIGWEFLDHLVTLAGLEPNAAVLDIGCGVGRLARPLTVFLGPQGRYHGFDIARGAIEWCRAAIGAHDGRFSFSHHNLLHPIYNPQGKVEPVAAVFPVLAGSVDVACAISVFTHLSPPVIRRYLAEAATALRPGGRLFCTAFLLDADTRFVMAEGRCRIPFDAASPALWQEGYPDHPGAAVAVDKVWFQAEAEAAGLTLATLRQGVWCGRAQGLTFQDVCVFERRAA